MSRPTAVIASVCLAFGLAWSGGVVARAQNNAAYRDCSLLVQGVDPDFVELFGVNITPQGTLTVPSTAQSVQLEASESADPGDSSGHVTLTATITELGVASTRSGAGTGRVVLTLPLTPAPSGTRLTISWAASFDGGFHKCPSPLTSQNTKPLPFSATVA